MNKSEIIIYQLPGGNTKVDVRLEDETVWLTLDQLSILFDKARATINEHILHIFEENELEKEHVMRKIGNPDFSTKPTNYYNLDVIISVGYRVKSKQGTQFRQWATQRLKDHLVKGYSLNEKRLAHVVKNLHELEDTIRLIHSTGNSEELALREAKGLLDIISNYTQSFVLLNQFDNNSLTSDLLNANITYEIQYNESAAAIAELKKQLVKKKEASNLFGSQKDESFKGILGSIVQTFGGEYLYKSIEEQAAHLLYFVIKNHPFSDGNKRIGAFLFIWFLEKNKHRFKKTGELKINDNALVALALLVAQSSPTDKELMIKLIINLINR